jgi:[acyl-carrier-protein] S-malonyltransferase
VALAACGPGEAAACAPGAHRHERGAGREPRRGARLLEELGLDPRNRNGAGQIVAAGPRDALARLADSPPTRAPVVPLAVAGAFHTRFMAPRRRRSASTPPP